MGCFDCSHGQDDSAARPQREHDTERRHQSEQAPFHFGTHFHSLTAHKAMTRGRLPCHDLEAEHRKNLTPSFSEQST
ncbi:MAG: hypothetical protein WCF85_09480 [Rhodospirillaceae bacterium]